LLAAKTLSEQLPAKLFQWSLVFASINLLALPVLAQDFWLSAAWGKMVSEGINPYHTDIPAQIAASWFPYTPIRMTYGPLWALISGMVMTISDNRWIIFAAFKVILGGFWLLALVTTGRLTSGLDVRSRCVATVMVGWLPLSVTQSLAEGHNDIVMASIVLFWLANRNSTLLVTATLIKYLTAPLLVLVLIQRRKRAELVTATAVGIAVFMVFFRGRGFFGADVSMNWRFMTPYDALAPLHRWAHLIAIPFLVLAARQVWVYKVQNTDLTLYKALIAILAVVVFSLLSHIWPWYLILILLPAALVPTWPVATCLTGLALAAPFSPLYLFRSEARDWLSPAPALIFYSAAVVWLVVVSWAIKSRGTLPGSLPRPRTLIQPTPLAV
jgi:alpha-1,6-mannosyltransferase